MELFGGLYIQSNTVKNNNIEVANGQFGSNMDIHIINNGPLTFMVES